MMGATRLDGGIAVDVTAKQRERLLSGLAGRNSLQ
jgi:hypothetical protein